MSGIFEQELKTGNKSGNSIVKAFSGSGIDVGRRRQKCSKIYASITNRVN